MKRTVLLIEDNDANRYLASFLLTKAGLEVVEAANGIDGVRLAIEHAPALIVMDIEMPGMDGYEAARRLRAHVRTARTPILAFSSYVHPADRERAFAEGVSDYLEKPFEVDEFLRRVFRLLPPPASTSP